VSTALRLEIPSVNNDAERVYYGLVRATGEQHSVAVLPAVEWSNLLRPDGSVTELTERPSILSNQVLSAVEIVSIASGIANASPGLMIARYDPDDAPTVINIDRYTAIENLPEHPIYQTVLQKGGVIDSAELRATLSRHVFLVKEKADPQLHWVEDFPQIFLDGLKKNNPLRPGTPS
jgi:hypothetical protein